MKISTKGRYGARAIVDIGENNTHGPVSLRELADRQDISLKYLEQIIPLLKAAGLVRSTRGSKGGYALARHPRDISLFDIVQALEGPMTIVDCLENKTACNRSNECATYEIWEDIQRAMQGVLQSTTLEGIIEKRRNQQKNGRR